jgi:sulfur-carrier protein adenylyltransferase/sulfurtransferase
MKQIIFLFLFFIMPNSWATESEAIEAYTAAKQGEAIIIDVREEHEVKAGMLDQARWYPLSWATQRKDWIKQVRELAAGKKIYLHCRSGGRSEQFLQMLKSQGIPAVNIGGFEKLKSIIPLKGAVR